MTKRGPYRKAGARAPAPAWRRTFLAAWREARGLTQEQLAGAAGLSVGLISSLEAGNTGYSAASLHRLAAALKIEPGMILSVNPRGDEPLWSLVNKANEEQRNQIARHAEVIIASKKRR